MSSFSERLQQRKTGTKQSNPEEKPEFVDLKEAQSKKDKEIEYYMNNLNIVCIEDVEESLEKSSESTICWYWWGKIFNSMLNNKFYKQKYLSLNNFCDKIDISVKSIRNFQSAYIFVNKYQEFKNTDFTKILVLCYLEDPINFAVEHDIDKLSVRDLKKLVPKRRKVKSTNKNVALTKVQVRDIENLLISIEKTVDHLRQIKDREIHGSTWNHFIKEGKEVKRLIDNIITPLF